LVTPLSETKPPFPALPQQPAELTEFQQFIYASTGRVLPIYGRSLFDNVPSTFAPVDRIPVTADYVIGPGDEILIRGWGQVNIDARVVVDRTGSIFIPKVGEVKVAGLRYEQLQEYLRSAIGRVFQNFDLNVTLGELRSIRVFVVGQVLRPGSYTVSSLSTLVNTIFASGGPSPKGSMRRIQLKRSEEVVTEFDLYDLLLKGDKSKDAVLLPGDVVFVPPAGQLVAVTGSVNVPAIYELNRTTTLGEAIEAAGGLATTAAGDKAIVERIENRTARRIEEFSLDAAGLAQPLQDGDLIRIVSLSPRFENAVTLRGNVAQPGRYAWRPGMRVSDLIPDREFLLTRDFWLAHYAIPDDGRIPPDERTKYWRRERVADTNNVDLPTYSDWIRFASKQNGQPQPHVQSQLPRQQQQPQQTDASRLNELDIRENGRPLHPEEVEEMMRNDVKRGAPDINWDYAVIQRLNPDTLTTRLLPFNLEKAVVAHEEDSNLHLQPGDVITIFSHADLRVPLSKQSKFIRLEGEFVAPGVYQVKEGDSLRDVVARAGGLTKDAFLFGSQFTRESTRMEQQKRLDTFLNQLEQEVERGAGTIPAKPEEAATFKEKLEGQRRLVQKLREIKATGRVVLELKPDATDVADVPEISLEDGDRLFVPAEPQTVNVIGSVYNENAYLFHPGKRVKDFLRLAGGPTRDADEDHIFIIRADGAVLSGAERSGWWSGGVESARLMRGDTVVVPGRLDKTSFLGRVKDLAQVVQPFALVAVVATR
jgi:protein involved in polysaccharide export with SLBB domain